MATLTIRNLPADVYERLKKRARANRRSITQEAAVIIEDAVGMADAPPDLWRQVDKVREAIRQRYGAFSDSTPLVREDRQR